MRDLRLIGVHEDGQRLLLSDSGGEQFSVPLDEPLRAAVRRDRPRLGQLQIEIDGGMRPREVQAMIRAGLSAEDVADRSGWPVEKVRRYEGPILAEREYVAGLARGVRLRGRAGGGSTTPTLAARVSARLSGRGVDPAAALWDSARNEAGEWTVVVTFPAGGRQREAHWHFDVPARTVTAADDEARWLSEEDSSQGASPLPAPHLATPPARATTVYDVEAEGGVQATPRRTAPPRAEEPLDLMTAMRERASHRGRPRRRGAKASATQTPGDQAPREDALPLEDLAYDPETMPPPPAARGPHPLDPAPASDESPTPEAQELVVDEARAEEPVLDESVRDGSVRDEAALDEPAVATPPEPGPQAEVEVETEVESEEDVEEPTATVERLTAVAPSTEPAPAHAPAPTPASNEVQDEQDDAADDRHEDVGPAAESDEPIAAPERPRPAKKSGRRSVPSWDDVMFGARSRD